MTTLDPLVMALSPLEPGVRRHLVSGFGRLGLPMDTLVALNAISDPTGRQFLSGLRCRSREAVHGCRTSTREQSTTVANRSAKILYTQRCYSSNTGTIALLEYASSGSPPLDLDLHSKASWRASGTAASAELIFSSTSSMDPDATIEIRQRANGWRTMGIV